MPSSSRVGSIFLQGWDESMSIDNGIGILHLTNGTLLEMTIMGFSKDQTYLLPLENQEDFEDMRPRLDSDVYLYQDMGDNNTMELFEVYSIKGEKVATNLLANWSSADSYIALPDKWERRTDLSGVTLEIGTLKYNPFVIYPENWDFEDNRLVSGIVMDILLDIQAILGFEINFSPSPDGFYGGQNKNGSWNGLVGMLTRNEADLVATGLTMTRSRSTGEVLMINIRTSFNEMKYFLFKLPDFHLLSLSRR